jgi:hypothetical protein
MATPTESKTTVRRIATMPNGCAQATMNRAKPNHTGRRANRAVKLCGSVADLAERALMFQYTTSKTQHIRIRIPASIKPILSPVGLSGAS